ncbi:MAG TPA: hypothetical protein VFY71_09195 [Planctomycetota bacterium]|nr:hypothetical protein [Planctomycetota bacterium]
MFTSAAALLAAAVLLPTARAQWDPQAAQWGKSDPADVRIMTWNVHDGLCSTSAKSEGANDWTALACTIAALQPDVLVLQECGDNAGHGTGTGVDTVADLATTLGLLVHGGFDPFHGVPVGACVQTYAPGFDLPFAFASFSTDGFNRNAILSRWPFADLNGDGKATLSDFSMLPDKWVATAGGGGIRGYALAEIDLPDALYAGDLVVGDSHLKAGSGQDDHLARVMAAQRIAYVIDHLFNGAGSGVPDPDDVIQDTPPATSLLAPATAVVSAGDWNENEDTDGTKGPAEWIIAAEILGGTDGTDRDGSDMARDEATDWFTGNPSSLGGTKYDYLAWQDSIATLRRAVIFNSQTIPIGSQPVELSAFPGSYTQVSGLASDHRPVFVDLELPLAGCHDGRDLGFGTPGTGGHVPHAMVCGPLISGHLVTFMLQDALPQAAVVAVAGLGSVSAPYAGGTLLPAPRLVVAGLVTDRDGALALRGVAGDGGPMDLYVQWIVQDPAAVSGKALSNALRVSWMP